MWGKRISLFFLGVAISFQLYAFQGNSIPFNWDELSREYQVRNFTDKDGLPLNSINYLVHHTDGYVYLATNDGLARFDGSQFTTFNTANSSKMRSNRIAWVGSGANNDLWFSDVSENLYRFKGGEVEWFQGDELYKNLKVKKVEVLKNQKILLTTDQGLLIQENQELMFNPFEDERTQEPFFNSFVLDGETIYFLQEKGFFSIKDGIVSELIDEKELLIPIDEIFNMIITKDYVKWFLGEKGQLLEIDTKGRQKLHVSAILGEAYIWDAKEISQEELILSTNKGYISFDRARGIFVDKGRMVGIEEQYFEDNGWAQVNDRIITKIGNSVYINDEKILETKKYIPFLTVDNDGSIWVATNGEGAYQIVKKKIINIGEEAYPGLVNVYGLTEDNGNIWAASFENNIFRISNTEITNWDRDNSRLDYIYYRSVYKANKGAVFAGNFDIWRYENNRWALYPANQSTGQVNVFFEDSKNRFWIGKDDGLYQVIGFSTIKFSDVNGLEIEKVTGIQELENRDLAILTVKDGIVILNESNTFSFLDIEDGLTSNLIRDLYVASRDTFWIVTEDKGLNRVILKPNYEVEEVKKISMNDGLIDNSLHRLIRDQFGYFWINSNKGIMRIKESLANDFLDGQISELQVQSFGEEDGLVSREGNGGVQHAGILTQDGKLLLPNQAGIVYTKPEWHLEKGKVLGQPTIETIFYEDTSEFFFDRSEIALPLRARDIQVKFSLPTFVTPDKLILEYKMEGVNADWQKVGSERLAVLTNLSSGEYTFAMRGKIAGHERFSEKEITIIVPPVFYETVWFLTVLLIVFSLLIYLGIRFLLHQSKKRETRLNSLVEERTFELIQEKEKTELALQQVQKLDESKSRFFTNFTHELRTPLALILNPLDDMLEEDGTQVSDIKSRSSLTLMKRNATRLKELINQLLDVSKLNSGELTFVFEPVDLLRLTERAASQFEDVFAKKEITFKITGDIELEHIYVDKNAWEHICTNLLSNALKFTPKKGGIYIKIEGEVDEVLVRVYDTGLGISKKDIPYIFDTYYQGDTSISRAGGTGIGLALVKGLVDKMSGSIAVESEEGIGTQFIIGLKKGKDHISPKDRISTQSTIRTPLEAKEEQMVLSNESNLSSSVKSLFTQKVLLVEDNDDFRAYLSRVIGEAYEVQVARNGAEGLELLKIFNPNIVVSDIMMPEMDGYEMMKKIREMEAYKKIPFIFLSAKNSAVDIETGLNVGADIYLPKPVQNKVLLTQIKVLLRREDTLLKVEEKESSTSLTSIAIEVHEIIQRHLGNPELNVELIARALSMSSPSLYRNWKKGNKESINHTITRLRFEEALKLIEEEGLSISEASYAVGYNHLSYFSKAFKKVYKVSPQEYVKRRMIL